LEKNGNTRITTTESASIQIRLVQLERSYASQELKVDNQLQVKTIRKYKKKWHLQVRINLWYTRITTHMCHTHMNHNTHESQDVMKKYMEKGRNVTA
jgi:hypothetical protein